MSTKRRKPTPYNEFDPIPSNPKTIVRAQPETPAEIAKRTGLNLDRLCERLMEWHAKGMIQHCLYGTPGLCTIPVFRIAP